MARKTKLLQASTWHVCLGCEQELGGETEVVSEERLMSHMGDTSANEQINYPKDSSRRSHLSTGMYKQILATYKLQEYWKKKDEGHYEGGGGAGISGDHRRRDQSTHSWNGN